MTTHEKARQVLHRMSEWYFGAGGDGSPNPPFDREDLEILRDAVEVAKVEKCGSCELPTCKHCGFVGYGLARCGECCMEDVKGYDPAPTIDDDESVRCTCEWAHPMHGEIDVRYPAELDPHCRVHGAPNDWPVPAEIKREVMDEEAALIRSGRKIQAIKAYRNRVGCTPYEAHRVIEEFATRITVGKGER